MTPNTKWEHFERLVAAIHRAADHGAEVKWNETINGRQFDVTVRFQKGLYKYLTVIECKDYEKPVPVEKVEAFVTKSQDVQANNSVMASRSGFQQGAQDVARRHNMTLIHVTDSSDVQELPYGARWAGTTDAYHIDRIELEYADGERKQLPAEANAATYYAAKIRLQCGSEQRSLGSLIEQHIQRLPIGKPDAYEDHRIPCLPGTTVAAPANDEIPLKKLACIRFRGGITRARMLTGPVKFDPYLIMPDVKVRNIDTGEEKLFNQLHLALGLDNEFAEGEFYEQPQAASHYYCEDIQRGLAHLYLVESFQHGDLIQTDFYAKAEYANLYVPVSDKAIIQRLQRRLASYKTAKARGKSASR
jgi:hypothetical protein